MLKNNVIFAKIKSALIIYLIISSTTVVFLFITLKAGGNWLKLGLLISFFITLLIVIYNNFIFNAVKKTNLLFSLLISSMYYTFIIFMVSTFSIFFLSSDKSYKGISGLIDIWISSKFITGMVFGLVSSVILNFMMAINNLLGKGVLLKLLIGLYHRPREEKKAFMFLDIKSSTSIAEKIGHKKFLSLVNDFFTDTAEAVIGSKAEIYKYVGDEMILVWDYKNTQKGEPVNCFFDIRKLLGKRSARYIRRYGLLPQFKASLHCGTVICGEVGMFKKEISYMGDVLNTASRLESLCSEKNIDFIASEDILKTIKIPDGIKAENLGNISLRNKENSVTVFEIKLKSE